MSFLLALTVIALVIGSIAIHVLTFRAIFHRSKSAFWSRGAVIAVIVGAVAGLASGILVRWRTEPNVEYVGFPIPGMVLVYTDGRWVDYVGPTVFIGPLLNALFVATMLLMPFSIALIIRGNR